jgi:bifunctional DNA-binding transcriptional regulator/antitoxin component of YhaV-PrlF toxin-antitoxin module
VVTLPAKLRRLAGIGPESQVIAEVIPEGVLLRPAVTLPVEVYAEDRLAEFAAAERELAVVLERNAGRR